MERVTEEWLMTIGFTVKSDGVLTLGVVENFNHLFRWFEVWVGGEEWRWAYCRLAQGEDRVSVPTPETRADVHRLCEALHIPTRERCS